MRLALGAFGLLTLLGCRSSIEPLPAADRPRPREAVAIAYEATDGAQRSLDIAYATVPDRGSSGRVLVFVHGLGTNLDTWARVLDPLAAHGTVLALDLPGAGQSDAPADYPYTLAALLDSLEQFVDRAPELAGRPEAQQVTLFGQSLGGGLAALHAARHPERLERLILCSPGGHPMELPLMLQAPRSELFGRALLALSNLLPGEVLARRFVHRAEARTPDLGDMLEAQRRNPARRYALHQILQNVIDNDVARRHWPEVASIRTPTLILWGTEDQLIPADLAPAWRDAIEGSELVLVPDTGHVPYEEDTPTWLRHVEDWLRR